MGMNVDMGMSVDMGMGVDMDVGVNMDVGVDMGVVVDMWMSWGVGGGMSVDLVGLEYRRGMSWAMGSRPGTRTCAARDIGRLSDK